MKDGIKLTENEKDRINALTNELVKDNASESVRKELYNRLATFVEGVKLGLIDKTPQITT